MPKQRRTKLKNNYEEYFQKKYKFRTPNEYILPEVMFESERWVIPQLQSMKTELNTVKSMLNKYDLKVWSKHTAFRDPSGSIIRKLAETVQPELLTQAWCKFYEILKNFPILPDEVIQKKKLNSLHLCEAPGAFVCSLNHYLVSEYPDIQLNWKATTLNPNYEGNELSQMITDDRFIRYTLENWNFGADFTGDITKFYNHCLIVNNDLPPRKVSIVTADGSVDCMKDPGEQEKFVEHLHFCETITALAVLQTGGTFVLKIFTMFEDSTINLLYLLNCLFETVTIFKPCTSKSGNSEVYVINLRYKGFNLLDKFWNKICDVYKNGSENFLLQSMFKIDDIPEQFLNEIKSCAHFFMKSQIQTILDNIFHFENKVPDNVQSKKWSVTKLFFQYHHINTIHEANKLLPGVLIGRNWRMHSQNVTGSVVNCTREHFIGSISFNINLDIKFGKKIDTVCSSKFAPKDSLALLQKNFQTTHNIPTLYQQVFKELCKDNIVLDVKEFDLSVYHKFQHSFFLKILKCVDAKNVILVNVPLLSHFLVGILYILMHGFKNFTFWNGCIILQKPDVSAMEKIKLTLNEINLIYLEINTKESCDFDKDIIHLVSPKRFDECSQDLVNLIWIYNCQIFAQKEVLSNAT